MPVLDGISWSAKATIPKNPPSSLPLPGTDAFNRNVHGRNGDLLILQLSSGEHLKAARRNTLRSLGLRGINSASLRRSDDPTTWGYIQAVRDLIAVVELGGVQYKAESSVNVEEDVSYESAQFGSNTRPSGIFRDTLGDYFSYESDRNGVLLNWSTDRDFHSALEAFLIAYDGPEPLAAEHSSLLGLRPTEPIENDSSSLEVTIGADAELIELPTDKAIGLTRSSSVLDVQFARLAFRGIDLTWHEPYVRFDDRETERAELGLYAHRLDLSKARTLARNTGNRGFFEQAKCRIETRENGTLKTYEF